MAFLLSGILLTFHSFAQETEGNTEKYGSNPESCKSNLSLYIEYNKQKNYDDAYQPWSMVFRECPKSSKNIYIHGHVIIWNKINKAIDQAVKTKFADTLMLMYDKQIQNFGEEGKVTGLKAIDFNKLYPAKKTDALKMFDKSLQLEGNNSDVTVISALFKTANDVAKVNGITDEQYLEYYYKCSEIISSQLTAGTDSSIKSKLQSAQNNIDILLSNSGKASCEKMVPVFTKKFETNKNDIPGLRTIVKFLSKQECTDSKVFADASEQLHKLEPSSLSSHALAQLFVKKNDYSNAVTYYLQAIDMETDAAKKAQYYYELALVSGTKPEQLNSARSYAYKAIEFRKNWGKPYILIGTLYAQSAKNCGENAFLQSMVYIAATDKFLQAKTVDRSCSEEAGKNIASYSSYLPLKEDVLANKMKEGDTFTIGCWINETIKIRVK